MTQSICQWVLVVFLVSNALGMVHADFNGAAPRVAKGFDGFMGTLLATIVLVAIFYGAGMFDFLFTWGHK